MPSDQVNVGQVGPYFKGTVVGKVLNKDLGREGQRTESSRIVQILEGRY